MLLVPNGKRALELGRKLLGEKVSTGLEFRGDDLLLRPAMSGQKHPLERAAWDGSMGDCLAVEIMELRGLLKVAQVVHA